MFTEAYTTPQKEFSAGEHLTTLQRHQYGRFDLCTNAQEDPLSERGSACVVVCNIDS